MNEFERQYAEICDFLRFGDTSLVVKRIIDLTLDTEALSHYKETVDLLHWLDQHTDAAVVNPKLEHRLAGLYATLSKKTLADNQLLVSAKSLSKSYSGGRFRLGPIDLQIKQGEIIGLVGENGNGKTTLLRSLARELVHDGGELVYHFPYTDGYDLRTQLVYIPQRTDTWYGSMRENLLFTGTLYGYGPEENEWVVELIVSRLGLRKFRDHSWKSLSSGYKMRFELARMLLRRPKILLIDEPLANLDILAQQTILEDFRSIAKSPFRPIGIVLSSQQLYEVEKTSDQVIFLKNGAQRNLFEKGSDDAAATPLAIELESAWTQGQLYDAFATTIDSIQFNGGTYIVYFKEGTSVSDVLKVIIDQNIPLLYFRDISLSTRRFFAS